MRIHIIGICGTFMGGLALLAKELGHEVTGSDANVYPPISTQLENSNIRIINGYSSENLESEPELVIIGNALSRGNDEVEAVLNKGLHYISGAQWLYENLLREKWVLAVAGTHGKTTTSSMLAWILEDAGLQPGFLIGGIPQNFGVSARLGSAPFFVIEADEYDTAFFDKRAKFVHYRPRTLVLNNLEYDHADIYSSISEIETQFQYLLRTVPGNGKILANAEDKAIKRVIGRGCWTPVEDCLDPRGWQAHSLKKDDSEFEVYFDEHAQGILKWDLIGKHNMSNGLHAIAAARHAGVRPQQAIDSLSRFLNVRRRMEQIYQQNGVAVYDDFAHHPTAIKTTIEAMKSRTDTGRVIAILDIRSNSMKMGVHKDFLAASIAAADETIVLQPQDVKWNLQQAFEDAGSKVHIFESNDSILDYLKTDVRSGDQIIIMSNGSFGGLHKQLVALLEQR